MPNLKIDIRVFSKKILLNFIVKNAVRLKKCVKLVEDINEKN